MQCVIRSSAQTLCDDLARAEEATDGKKKSAAGHTWCRREYCNCVCACEEHFAPALYGMPPYLIDHYERLPWNVNLSTCMTQMPSWVLPTGMAVSLAMTGAVYPHPDSALSGSAVPPWGGAGMAMMLNADLTGRLWKYVVPVVWADDDVQEALLRGFWGSLVGSWSALVLVLHVLPSLCLTGSPLQFWIRLMYISSRPFLRTLVQLVAVLSFLTPATNAVYPQRIWLFLLGLAPFFVAGSAGVCFRTKRKSGWGICGSSWAGCGFLFGLTPLLVDYCKYTATVLCTFLGFTTSTSVRTEPQATSAAPEEKKKLSLLPVLFGPTRRN